MKLIAAVDQNWAIGHKNSLLVKIPEDQKNFMKYTMGNTIVLGRKTLAGFPNGIPLAGRTNIILSSRDDFTAKDSPIAHSVEELFEILKDYDTDSVYVVGGGKIYSLLEPYCDEAIITKLDYKYQADTWFPNLDEKENWELVETSEEKTYFSIEYHYLTYKNRSPISF
ncbi:MAG: dihydrofolate reductase [Eubacterium sp.]|nr:dihydrofolate reductase [Eubacterium sp.]